MTRSPRRRPLDRAGWVLATYRQGMRGALARRRLKPAAIDRLLAAGLAAWALFDVPWWWRPPGHRGPELMIGGLIALAAVQSAPFLWRRRQPVIVLAAAVAALATKAIAHLNVWSACAAVLAAAYGLGAYGSHAVRRAVKALVAVAVIATIVSLQAGGGNHSAAIACALLATALAVGEITATHRDLGAGLAAQQRQEERASLAREIHDVVAHQLSAIAVQAGAARVAAADDPRAAATAVATIEQGAREGLEELNTLVRHLRHAEAPGGNDTALGPGGQQRQGPSQPRLVAVPILIERAKKSGLHAELVVDGEARPLADAVELAGYRVVQEALTNAIRHAGGTAATARLCYSAAGILIEVTDQGPVYGAGAPADLDLDLDLGGGAGLAGLSERVGLLGGEFEARRCRQGFVVRAFLPSPP